MKWGLGGAALRQHFRLARTLRALCAGGPAVVHCGRAQPEGVAAALAAALPGGPPFLLWAHGEEITTAQSSRHFGWVMRRVHARASAVIANSRNTVRTLERAGMNPAKIALVYPGVDTTRFHPDAGADVRRRLAPAGELVLATVGRLQPRKGHATALRALSHARHRLPPFRYVIVGDGPERPRLEAVAAEAGIADRVVFAGQVSFDDLPAYFAACDVFLHPNIVVDVVDFEGFGLVFLEAAAAGKPSIGGNSGGVPEAVVDGVTGLLVSGTDVEELAHAIERLAASAELRRVLGGAGRVRVLESFTWDAAARQVEAIHARVARGG